MSDDFEAYEEVCNKIRNSNKKLLAQFEEWLSKKNLAPKTVHNAFPDRRFKI